MAIIDTFGCANRLAGSPGFAPVPGPRSRRPAAFSAPLKIAFHKTLIGDISGFAAVEFALLVPVLVFLALGALMLGSDFNDFIVITNAAQAGTFQLTVSRDATTTPYDNTVTAVKNSTYLSPSKLAQLTITLTIAPPNGTASPCVTNSACKTALTNAVGGSATVKVSYPCQFTKLKIGNLQMNIPGCPLTSQSTGRIQ